MLSQFSLKHQAKTLVFSQADAIYESQIPRSGCLSTVFKAIFLRSSLRTSGWAVLIITLRRLIGFFVNFAIGLTLSRFTADGKLSFFFTLSRVALSAYTAAHITEIVRELLKSASIVTGAKPALIAPAEPVDDLNGFYTS